MRHNFMRVSAAVGGIALVLATGASAESLDAAGLAGMKRAERSPAAPAGEAVATRPARRLSRAERALLRARALFHLRAVQRRHGWVTAPGPQAATRVLQELALTRRGLAPRQRRRAGRLMARPTDGAGDQFDDGYETENVENACISQPQYAACVHWVEETADAPPLDDGNVNDIPDQIDLTLATVDEVLALQVVDMGYRAPLPDAGPADGHGPNAGLDVYVADTGADGLFGYCAADPGATGPARPAYCVVDDDYDPGQFPPPAASGSAALQVAVAHELFHAIQFAYEYSAADQWLKEGTAAWMEGRAYPDVDSNLLYLAESPLMQPEVPLDAFGGAGDANDSEYGAWVFWQFLTEWLANDDVVREVWESTAPAGGTNRTTVEALRQVLPGHPSSPHCYAYCSDPATFRAGFAEFGVWNALYPLTYGDGDEYLEALDETLSPFDAAFELSSDYDDTGQRSLPLARLSTRQVSVAVLPSQVSTTQVVFRSDGGDVPGNATEATALRIIGNTISVAPIGTDSLTGHTNVNELVVLGSNAAASGSGPFRYFARLEPE